VVDERPHRVHAYLIGSFTSYGGPVRRSQRWWLAGLMVTAVLPLSLTGSSSAASASSLTSCRAPRMTGLTVSVARDRARVAGCRVRLTGAKVRMPTIQTIRSQSVPPGRAAKVVTASVNPLCPSSADIGPPPGEPIVKPGPTELITGLFIEGGPPVERSAPVCKDLVGKSSGGRSPSRTRSARCSRTRWRSSRASCCTST
jgi:hypothetical protein